METVDSRANSGRIYASFPFADGGIGNNDGVVDMTDSRPAMTGSGDAYLELVLLHRAVSTPVGGLRRTKLAGACPGGGGNCDGVITVLLCAELGVSGEGEESSIAGPAMETRIDMALAVK